MLACPTCGTENAPGARACVSCGVPLEVQAGEGSQSAVCTSCGAENSLQASFCGSCGLALQHPPTAGVYQFESRHGSPRELGDLLGETFRVYRERFWLFFTIALIAQIPFLIVEVFTAESFPLGLNLAIAIIGISVGIVLYILVNPAIINAVTWGTSIAGCYRDAANRFWTLFLAAIVFSSTLLLCVALMLIIVGIPLFFHVLISWLFYPQAVMLEGKGPLESLKYSKEMVAGNRWRLLGVGATFFLIGLVLTLALFIPVGIILVFSTTAGNVVGIAATAAVMPIAYIGATLVYFELRGSRDRQIPSA